MIGSVETVGEFPQPSSVPNEIGESSKPPPTAPKSSEKTATKADCPPELRPIVEAEQRRAAEAAANLALCSAAISGVETTLLTFTNGSNRQIVDSMSVYLRAAIAQYRASGSATTPPVLSPRQANPLPWDPDARSTPILAAPVQPSKSNWAPVAKN
ncbi:EKA-like protein [Blumeria hordei DH14]|uniref:EKA-like protein n=1 Tax=Blumeria graminis f. sp. hordei (strain DH14) TaxID=546991 RepID=N1J6J7_BLUG1|nr:EKA-like protein [Blumeria hordei DH14]